MISHHQAQLQACIFYNCISGARAQHLQATICV